MKKKKKKKKNQEKINPLRPWEKKKEEKKKHFEILHKLKSKYSVSKNFSNGIFFFVVGGGDKN